MVEDRIFAEVALDVKTCADGTMILRNRLSLPPMMDTIPDRIDYWARIRPNVPYLTERGSSGRTVITFEDAARRMHSLAARLLRQPVSNERPLMIVANNGIGHALVMLAATRVGLPVAVVSPGYCSLGAAPWAKFQKLMTLVVPGLIVAENPQAISEVLSSLGFGDIPVYSILDLGWLEASEKVDDAALARAIAAVGPDTLAKLLFTSGSTGTPKAVMNSQRMMVSNMQALELIWPFLSSEQVTLTDWLPWNHTFGGNVCFNLATYYGGTLHIDDGKPLPAQIGRTVELLRETSPTIYFNVPAGYEELLPHLEADPDLAARFLGGVRFLFTAAAPMPKTTYERMSALSKRVTGRPLTIASGWGATETAPFATAVYFTNDHPANLGVSVPGTEIKLVPIDGRTELRVRGPNVMPGYFRQKEHSDAAFDEEGFFCIGDAGRLLDPKAPERGILFDGRIAENFKLSTGTWVNVNPLRLAIIASASGLISDVVVVGEGREEIGLLIFLNQGACQSVAGPSAQGENADPVHANPKVLDRIREALVSHNVKQLGSSTRIARFSILTEPASPEQDEITEKGYLNQRRIIARRAQDVANLYSGQTAL